MKRTTLLAWRAGALEPPEMLAVEEAVALAPELLVDLPEVTPVHEDPWRLPPQGWGLGAAVRDPAVMRGRRRAGDRFSVVFDRELTGVLIVLRQRDRWEVVSPAGDEVPLRVEALPRVEGRPVLELAADVQPTQRWGFAIADEALWGEGWVALQQAVAAGRVPVTTVLVRLGA